MEIRRLVNIEDGVNFTLKTFKDYTRQRNARIITANQKWKWVNRLNWETGESKVGSQKLKGKGSHGYFRRQIERSADEM